MTKISVPEMQLKSMLVNLRMHQISELDRISLKLNCNRSELIREAVDLLIHGVQLREDKEPTE